MAINQGTTLERREEGVTLVESLYLGEDRHSHRRWRGGAQSVLRSLILYASIIVLMVFRWGVPLLAPASQHPVRKCMNGVVTAYVLMCSPVITHAPVFEGIRRYLYGVPRSNTDGCSDGSLRAVHSRNVWLPMVPSTPVTLLLAVVIIVHRNLINSGIFTLHGPQQRTHRVL